MLQEAFFDLDNNRVDQELKFTQRLGQYPHEYKNKNARACKLGKVFGKEKGDLVYWFETYTEERKYIKNAKCYKEIRKKNYSINLKT
jgi:hypothetical protein